jgi:acetate---CoA ligase (ADP-forming)
MRLDPLFKPGSIAVIGASDKPGVSRRLMGSFGPIGFTGEVFPVNPNYETVGGYTCFPSIADLPQAPDIAVFCLGSARVLDAFIAGAERGMKAAVIYDGGFAEQGAAGRALQTRIEDICREAGILLVGPNCMGVLNPHHKSTTYMQELQDATGLAGNVGIVSQSGAVCIALLNDIRRFGFSHVVSAGNEAVVAAADYLEHLVEEPETEIIGCFIETIRHKERFAATLDRAAALGKPVVVLKVGQAARTRRAIVAHTSGPADDPDAALALLREHRAIVVSDLSELTETLAACQAPKRPAGRRIGLITSSGGLAEIILDIAAANDFRVPPLSPSQKAEIEGVIGFVTGDGNPCDAWGSGTFATNLPAALAMFDASTEHDVIVLVRDNFDLQPFDVPQTAKGFFDLLVAAANSSAKPHYVMTSRPGIMDRSLVAYLRQRGIAVVSGLREGLAAIDRLARHQGG